ncbi:hypothetical protein Tco_0362708 [Tanacetum coccineum]
MLDTTVISSVEIQNQRETLTPNLTVNSSTIGLQNPHIRIIWAEKTVLLIRRSVLKLTTERFMEKYMNVSLRHLVLTDMVKVEAFRNHSSTRHRYVIYSTVDAVRMQ